MKISEMVNEFAETTKQTPDPDLMRKLVTEEFVETIEAAGADEYSVVLLEHCLKGISYSDPVSKSHELKELADLIYVIYGYARVQGYDLDGAVEAVHENNLGRIRQPDGSIKRREDGKILKNPDYPKVNLNDYIGS